MTEQEHERVEYEFGRRLRELRESRGLSKGRAERESGACNSSWAHWENGRSFPNFVSLLQLAAYFGVSLDWLMTGREFGEERKAS